jgi:hypothetical protein
MTTGLSTNTLRNSELRTRTRLSIANHQWIMCDPNNVPEYERLQGRFYRVVRQNELFTKAVTERLQELEHKAELYDLHCEKAGKK